MAEDFLRDYPGLRQFVLSDVQPTGKRIGSGAYGRVEEVAVPVGAAAKTIYALLQEGDGTTVELPKAATEFVRECQLMSTLRHPNIVQFLGVTFFPDSRLPALVMERLLTSLHDLLAPDPPRPAHVAAPLSFFSMALKCSVLLNVACGLAYLHGQSPPVIHRDLSARNVLLNSDMVCKIADLGVARIVPRVRAAATMTKGPGALVYMPPEAFESTRSNDGGKSKYDASIDIFSFGVITIFTIGEIFPCDPLAATYLDEKSGLLARTEVQRRAEYMDCVNHQLRASNQLLEDHPLIRLIQQCLHNGPSKRLSIHGVLRLLEEARACFSGQDSARNKRELVQALQTQPRKQNLEHVFHNLVTENADLQTSVKAKDTEITEAQQQLRGKDKELKTAEEIISRGQQQIQEMIQRDTELVQAKDRELAEAQQKLQQILRAIPLMKDAQGTQRGTCNICECPKYVAPVESGKQVCCEYCRHHPTHHVHIVELGRCRTTGCYCGKYYPSSNMECQYCGCGAKSHDGDIALCTKKPSLQIVKYPPKTTTIQMHQGTMTVSSTPRTSPGSVASLSGGQQPIISPTQPSNDLASPSSALTVSMRAVESPHASMKAQQPAPKGQPTQASGISSPASYHMVAGKKTTRSSYAGSSGASSTGSTASPADDERKKMITIEKKPREPLGIITAQIPNETGYRIMGVELDTPAHCELKKGNIKLLDLITLLNEDNILSREWFEQRTRDKTKPMLTLWRNTKPPNVDKLLSRVKEKGSLATHIRLVMNPFACHIGSDFGIEPVQTTNVQGAKTGILAGVHEDSSAHLSGVTIRDEILMYFLMFCSSKILSEPKFPTSVAAVARDFKAALTDGKHLILVLRRHPIQY